MERWPQYRMGTDGVSALDRSGDVISDKTQRRFDGPRTWASVKPVEYVDGSWKPAKYKPNPIGVGKPLKISIASACVGPLTGDVLVGSAVRDSNVSARSTVAMNRLLDRSRTSPLVEWHASEDGSPVIYYSPRVKERELFVTLLLEENLFDRKKWLNLVDNVASVAGIPAFLAGFGGAGMGTAIVTTGAKIAQAAVRVIDQVVDGDPPSPLTVAMSLADEGRFTALEPGYVLIYGRTKLERPATSAGPNGWPTPDFGRQPVSDPELPDHDELVVSRHDGSLMYASREYTVVDDFAYVVLHIDGTADESLKGWRAAAISADLTDQFLNVRAEDNGELTRSVIAAFTSASDLTVARDITAVDKELAKLEDESGKPKANLPAKQQALREKLIAQRDELLSTIDDDTVEEAFSRRG